MSKRANPTIRYVRVEIRPAMLCRFDGPTVMEAHIQVETEYDRYALDEMIPNDDFTRRFDWYIERAKEEIAAQILKPATE
jgi:hypothetical protein